FLRSETLGEPLPSLDLGVGMAPLRWVLAYPVALGAEGGGAIVLAGIHFPAADAADGVRDATRQLAVALHNAWTHDRLREKSTALTEQGERLTRANKVKTSFLASMSHELRTPLSAILGFADLLLTSSKEQLSSRARESLERIKRNGEHLLGLINLLANAIKFTDEGEIMINVRATANEVQVAVRDTGIGIPAHAMKELFQDFHQLEAGDGRRYDGTGVGLALSRRLARALGGEIEARSRQGEGSTFTLVLPRIPPQAQAQAGETVALLVPASTRPEKALS